MSAHPINIVVADDLARSRLTVFFRYLLVLPPGLWLYLWSIPAGIVLVINWFATLLMGQSPAWAHNFLSSYLRYSIHVSAYGNLMANPWPGFSSKRSYPVTVEIAPPEQQRRLITFFRILLAIPASIIAYILQIPLGIVVIVGWFVALILGRWPASFERITAYCLQYNTRTNAYTFLLTQRYPRLGSAKNIDPLENGDIEGNPV